MNEQNNNTRLIKIFLIGDSDVGKTSILKQFIENRFDEINQLIIGIDFRYVHIDNDNDNDIDNQPVKLVIWDPSGQSRFKDITRLYYKKTNIVNDFNCGATSQIRTEDLRFTKALLYQLS